MSSRQILGVILYVLLGVGTFIFMVVCVGWKGAALITAVSAVIIGITLLASWLMTG